MATTPQVTTPMITPLLTETLQTMGKVANKTMNIPDKIKSMISPTNSSIVAMLITTSSFPEKRSESVLER